MAHNNTDTMPEPSLTTPEGYALFTELVRRLTAEDAEVVSLGPTPEDVPLW